ncbi:hypothetical protein FXN65_24095 [Metapseudomonas lalkuanensis]|uniref:DUF3944 domain-containing protein n=1 Tax=Metapseudomonas lalkuanensis TaxID=2604832 RepID=A0A5J6QR77_9GAMM|nr:ubiquinol-cytochrome C chaperone family protein [Pseudomonas lalkuanensis]QEY64990.1 hypothetical protein FXN65_24095 [Pseudomonas lalkuanensis]
MSDESGAQALQQLLAKADRVYLDLLVDYITDGGKGRLMLSAGNCKALVQAKAQGDYSTATLALLVSELLHFGGNSVVNLLRSEGAAWPSIVVDVLDHLKGKRQDGDSIVELERRVLVQLLETLWDKLSTDELESLRRALKVEGMPGREQIAALREAVMGATDTGVTVAQVLTAAMASSAFGAGAVFTGMSMGSAAAGAAQFLASRGASVALGPIGLALGSIWGAYSLTGPALRITVPCVVLIALIRLETRHPG